MATRRRSMAALQRREELPAAAALKPSNRRKSVAPAASKMTAPKSRPKNSALNKKPLTSKAPSKKVKKVEETVESFVAADQFDFGLPDKTPDLHVGPMTRSRRTSVYGRAGKFPAPAPLPDSRSARRKTIAAKLEPVFESSDAGKSPRTSTAMKPSKALKVTINEPMTPIVSLERIQISGRKTARKTPFKAKIDHEEVLSAVPANLTPAKSAKKKRKVEEPVFMWTPQPADPAILLRRNLKRAVDSKIDERVSNLPSSSPYALLIGETENGSPIERFVKAKKPERKEASKFVTATPAPAKRRAFEPIEIEKNDASPELPRRRASLNVSSKSASKSAPRSPPKSHPRSLETGNASPVKSLSPCKGQFVTGDLVKACCIM